MLVRISVSFSPLLLRHFVVSVQESIADYYGEATAFYFAWMGFYTQGLVIPSIFGLIVFGCQVWKNMLLLLAMLLMLVVVVVVVAAVSM